MRPYKEVDKKYPSHSSAVFLAKIPAALPARGVDPLLAKFVHITQQRLSLEHPAITDILFAGQQ
jgi:hypothetical protein